MRSASITIKIFSWLAWFSVLCLVHNSTLNKGCNAQLQEAFRFFINLGSDLAEIFSRLPTSSLAGAISPVLKSAQNQIYANRPIARVPTDSIRSSNDERILLYNDRRRVRFLVYNNRRNPQNYFELNLDSPSSIPLFRIRRDSNVKILIHGFQSSPRMRFPQYTKDEYLASTNHGVIVVDWSDLATPAAKNIKAQQALYFAVTDNVPRAGRRVYELVEFLLHNQIITDLRQIHIVGHSLGAHVASQAGKFLFQRFGRKVARITGLDPAAPLFRSVAEDRRLSFDDADFVDVIHTSLAGLYTSVGHADFYPNGGQVQPQCLSRFQNKNSTSDTFISCNHHAANDYFANSIRQRRTACECKSYQEFRQFCKRECSNSAILGEYVSSRSRGRFFLDIFL